MSGETKERPILFNGEMVRAILDGRKTQTRRVVNCDFLNPESYLLGNHKGTWGIHRDIEKNGPGDVWRGLCPFGVSGDQLWVRESFVIQPWLGLPLNTPQPIEYLADITDRKQIEDYAGKPSIHMPRWASRLTLEITEVRVERLNKISEADAKAEGVGKVEDRSYSHLEHGIEYRPHFDAFQNLWQSINGPESWSVNPWVWVVEFRRVNNA